MKKLLAIGLMGGVILAACSKKETATESDTMMQEPQTTNVQDSPTKAYGDGSPEAPDSVTIDPERDLKK